MSDFDRTDGDASGRGTDDGDGSVPRTDDGDTPTADTDGDGPTPIAFLDCDTVHLTGEFADVVLSLFWWEPDGLVGTIAEPVGGVDGERTIVAGEEFGEFAYGPIVSGVDAYEAGTPVVPGGGDCSRANPAVDSCIDRVRERTDDSITLEAPFPE